MKRTFTFIFISFVAYACTKTSYQVSDLELKNIGFKDLPLEVRQFFELPLALIDTPLIGLQLVCLDSINIYRLESVKSYVGPWIDHNKLTDLKRNISYKIDSSMPSPYVIFDNRLYLTTKYNFFTTVDKSKYSSMGFKYYTLYTK